MPVPELPLSLWIMLGVIVGLQVILMLQVAGLSARVRRLRDSRGSVPVQATVESGGSLEEVKARNSEQKQWFARFLEEDPSRRDLPKKEQFEAFRRWRNERGLNWRAPGDPG